MTTEVIPYEQADKKLLKVIYYSRLCNARGVDNVLQFLLDVIAEKETEIAVLKAERLMDPCAAAEGKDGEK